jgi:hypothetical protein
MKGLVKAEIFEEGGMPFSVCHRKTGGDSELLTRFFKSISAINKQLNGP